MTHCSSAAMTAQKIYIAGHRGMVGSAIVRTLQQTGQATIITRTRAELDLTDQVAVRTLFATEKPDQVNLVAAKEGGLPLDHDLGYRNSEEGISLRGRHGSRFGVLKEPRQGGL